MLRFNRQTKSRRVDLCQDLVSPVVLFTLSNTLGDKEEWGVNRAMELSVGSNEPARAPVTEELSILSSVGFL